MRLGNNTIMAHVKDCQESACRKLLEESDAHLILISLLEKPKSLTEIAMDVLPEQRGKTIFRCPNSHAEKVMGKLVTQKNEYPYHECPDLICPYCRKKGVTMSLRKKCSDLGPATHWSRRDLSRKGILLRLTEAGLIVPVEQKGRDKPYRINWDNFIDLWRKDIAERWGDESGINWKELRTWVEKHHEDVFRFKNVEPLIVRRDGEILTTAFGIVNTILFYLFIIIIERSGCLEMGDGVFLGHWRKVFAAVFSTAHGISLEDATRRECEFYKEFSKRIEEHFLEGSSGIDDVKDHFTWFAHIMCRLPLKSIITLDNIERDDSVSDADVLDKDILTIYRLGRIHKPHVDIESLLTNSPTMAADQVIATYIMLNSLGGLFR